RCWARRPRCRTISASCHGRARNNMGDTFMDEVRKRLASLRLPVVCAPMFIVSNPEMVIAQCKSGRVGAFPALNARPQSELAIWLERITTALAAHAEHHPEHSVAPFAWALHLRGCPSSQTTWLPGIWLSLS